MSFSNPDTEEIRRLLHKAHSIAVVMNRCMWHDCMQLCPDKS